MAKEIEAPKIKQENRLEALDGLRGLAIILVMWFHLWQQSWLANKIEIGNTVIRFDFIPAIGFLGVDLFFFISAFCLFYPYAKTMLEGAKEQTLKRFAYRRFIKIVPSYYLALIIMGGMAFSNKFQSIGEGLWHLLRHALFINCFFPDTYYGSLNPVFWSTAVEVQFYILFPLICYCFRKKPFTTYISLFVIGNLYRHNVTAHHMDKLSTMLNQLPGVIDIFAAGMLAAYLMVYMRSKIKEIEGLKPFMTFAAIVALVVFFKILNWGYGNYGNIQLWQINTRYYLGWLFIILGVSAAFTANILKRLIANKIFVFASTISYNLYIWHQWIAVKLKENNIPGFNGNDPHLDFSWQVKYTLLAITTSVAVAAFITYFIEKPLLNEGFRGYLKGLKNEIGRIKTIFTRNNKNKSAAA